jgi:nitroimidazol reductase NimA-like FMN-containing flavoprotein (pyridoxamine 5'-phosphate oxidase superfamily)
MINYHNDKVRRQDRLLERENALELLRTGEYGVLAMVECADGENGGYGIPVNYVWDGAEAIYIHCAPEGHKLRCIERNSHVSFCVVGHTNVIPHKFTTAYESIVVRGKAHVGLSEGERMHALELLLGKYSPDNMETGLKYAEKSFARTEIIRIDISEASGKTKRVLP